MLAAAFVGHLDAACVLLDHGANVHLKKTGKYAVFVTASSRGYVEIMRLFLEHGTKPEIVEERPSDLYTTHHTADELMIYNRDCFCNTRLILTPKIANSGHHYTVHQW